MEQMQTDAQEEDLLGTMFFNGTCFPILVPSNSFSDTYAILINILFINVT